MKQRSLASKLSSVFLSLLFFVSNSLLANVPEANFWAERQSYVNNSGKKASSSLQLAALPSSVISNPGNILKQLPPTHTHRLNPSISRQLKKYGESSSNKQLTSILNALPYIYGNVRDISIPQNSKTNKTIIHIQDVHLNAEAQSNIGSTIQELMDKELVGVIGLEGAFDRIKVEQMRSFPDKKIIKQVSGFLFEKNKISGPIHSVLTSTKDQIPPFIGVDHPTLYNENVDSYKEAVPLQSAYLEKLSTIKNEIQSRKKSVFNKDLLVFDNQIEGYRENRIELGKHLRHLAELSEKTPLAVDTFLAAYEMESKIDFQKVETERSKLIKKLVEKLDQSQVQELARQSIAYRIGQANHSDFYTYIRDLCTDQGLNLARYPAMSSYIQYILLSDSIKPEALFEAISTLEKHAYTVLSETPEEKRLINKSKQTYLTHQLLNFALTPDEWEEYHNFNKTNDSLNVGDLTSFEKFYVKAEERNEALVNNLMKAMENNDTNVAVLVTGGFHSPGINKKLNQLETTTISFTPKITKIETENGSEYLGIFTQEKTPLEQMFQGDKLFLAGNPAAPAVVFQYASMVVTISIRAGQASFDFLSQWFWSLTGMALTGYRIANDYLVNLYVSWRTSSGELSSAGIDVEIGPGGTLNLPKRGTPQKSPLGQIAKLLSRGLGVVSLPIILYLDFREELHHLIGWATINTFEWFKAKLSGQPFKSRLTLNTQLTKLAGSEANIRANEDALEGRVVLDTAFGPALWLPTILISTISLFFFNGVVFGSYDLPNWYLWFEMISSGLMLIAHGSQIRTPGSDLHRIGLYFRRTLDLYLDGTSPVQIDGTILAVPTNKGPQGFLARTFLGESDSSMRMPLRRAKKDVNWGQVSSILMMAANKGILSEKSEGDATVYSKDDLEIGRINKGGDVVMFHAFELEGDVLIVNVKDQNPIYINVDYVDWEEVDEGIFASPSGVIMRGVSRLEPSSNRLQSAGISYMPNYFVPVDGIAKEVFSIEVDYPSPGAIQLFMNTRDPDVPTGTKKVVLHNVFQIEVLSESREIPDKILKSKTSAPRGTIIVTEYRGTQVERTAYFPNGEILEVGISEEIKHAYDLLEEAWKKSEIEKEIESTFGAKHLSDNQRGKDIIYRAGDIVIAKFRVYDSGEIIPHEYRARVVDESETKEIEYYVQDGESSEDGDNAAGTTIKSPLRSFLKALQGFLARTFLGESDSSMRMPLRRAKKDVNWGQVSSILMMAANKGILSEKSEGDATVYSKDDLEIGRINKGGDVVMSHAFELEGDVLIINVRGQDPIYINVDYVDWEEVDEGIFASPSGVIMRGVSRDAPSSNRLQSAGISYMPNYFVPVDGIAKAAFSIEVDYPQPEVVQLFMNTRDPDVPTGTKKVVLHNVFQIEVLSESREIPDKILKSKTSAPRGTIIVTEYRGTQVERTAYFPNGEILEVGISEEIKHAYDLLEEAWKKSEIEKEIESTFGAKHLSDNQRGKDIIYRAGDIVIAKFRVYDSGEIIPHEYRARVVDESETKEIEYYVQDGESSEDGDNAAGTAIESPLRNFLKDIQLLLSRIFSGTTDFSMRSPLTEDASKTDKSQTDTQVLASNIVSFAEGKVSLDTLYDGDEASPELTDFFRNGGFSQNAKRVNEAELNRAIDTIIQNKRASGVNEFQIQILMVELGLLGIFTPLTTNTLAKNDLVIGADLGNLDQVQNLAGKYQELISRAAEEGQELSTGLKVVVFEKEETQFDAALAAYGSVVDVWPQSKGQLVSQATNKSGDPLLDHKNHPIQLLSLAQLDEGIKYGVEQAGADINRLAIGVIGRMAFDETGYDASKSEYLGKIQTIIMLDSMLNAMKLPMGLTDFLKLAKKVAIYA